MHRCMYHNNCVSLMIARSKPTHPLRGLHAREQAGTGPCDTWSFSLSLGRQLQARISSHPCAHPSVASTHLVRAHKHATRAEGGLGAERPRKTRARPPRPVWASWPVKLWYWFRSNQNMAGMEGVMRAIHENDIRAFKSAIRAINPNDKYAPLHCGCTPSQCVIVGIQKCRMHRR